jgi:hypothetical protein
MVSEESCRRPVFVSASSRGVWGEKKMNKQAQKEMYWKYLK